MMALSLLLLIKLALRIKFALNRWWKLSGIKIVVARFIPSEGKPRREARGVQYQASLSLTH